MEFLNAVPQFDRAEELKQIILCVYQDDQVLECKKWISKQAVGK